MLPIISLFFFGVCFSVFPYPSFLIPHSPCYYLYIRDKRDMLQIGHSHITEIVKTLGMIDLHKWKEEIDETV
jgi:hypothetical protein